MPCVASSPARLAASPVEPVWPDSYVCERFQNWVRSELEAVIVLPLDVADPNDNGREFMGVDVGLDAVKLLGAGARPSNPFSTPTGDYTNYSSLLGTFQTSVPAGMSALVRGLFTQRPIFSRLGTRKSKQ
jgi:hypothetical protein